MSKKKLAANIRILIGFTILLPSVMVLFGFAFMLFGDDDLNLLDNLGFIPLAFAWYIVLSGRDVLSELG